MLKHTCLFLNPLQRYKKFSIYANKILNLYYKNSQSACLLACNPAIVFVNFVSFTCLTHLFCKKNPDKLYYRNDYLIGHGEFIPYSVYRKYYFPEQQITDGIQLGYRLSMSGADICPLNSFCSDDVPQSLRQLIGQHKRWFGGCNLLLSSYRWCKKNIGIASMCQVIDGFWSQLSWAYAGIIGVAGLILSLICIANGNFFLASLELIGLFIYCYIIPYISHVILPFPLKIRFIDWLCLPLAIFVKGIGPNLYIFQTVLSVFTRKKIKYSKVER